jgi:hypothetical protein
MIKSHLKIKPQSPKEKISRYLCSNGFAPDCSATILAAKCVLTPMSIPSIIDFYVIDLLIISAHSSPAHATGCQGSR